MFLIALCIIHATDITTEGTEFTETKHRERKQFLTKPPWPQLFASISVSSVNSVVKFHVRFHKN